MGGVLVKRRIIPLLLIRLLNEFITKPVILPFLLSRFTFQVFRASYETLDMGSTPAHTPFLIPIRLLAQLFISFLTFIVRFYTEMAHLHRFLHTTSETDSFPRVSQLPASSTQFYPV